MRKQTKIVAVLSAAALLAIGASMTSFAATGWQAVDGTYVYYDANGDMVTDSWKKDGDQYFYLDGDGYMATNKMVDEYYVGANGARVKNTWVKLIDEDEADDPEVEAAWYYFGSNGKAVESGWRLINGKYYHFDDSKMQTGWKDIDNETYYLGGEDEGWRTTGWAWLEENADEDEATGEEYWYYFGSNGKMVDAEAKKKISGKYYAFDAEGRMVTGWMIASGSDTEAVSEDEANSFAITDAKYAFDNVDTGNLVNGWIKVPTLNESSDTAWYYFKDGQAYAAASTLGAGYKTTPLASVSNASTAAGDARGIATIKGKVYCFDGNGKGKSGIVKVKEGTTERKFFFSDSLDSDGSMKTGKIKVYDSDDDETYTYFFSKKAETTNGVAYVKGEAKRGAYEGYFYNEETSRLVKAGSDDRYISTNDGVGGYCVNTSGKIMKASTGDKKALTAKNDIYYVVDDKGIVLSIHDNSKDANDAAK